VSGAVWIEHGKSWRIYSKPAESSERNCSIGLLVNAIRWMRLLLVNISQEDCDLFTVRYPVRGELMFGLDIRAHKPIFCNPS